MAKNKDKCSANFFKSVRQNNKQVIISELRDKLGRCFTMKKYLGKICLDFYKDLYQSNPSLLNFADHNFTWKLLIVEHLLFPPSKKNES